MIYVLEIGVFLLWSVIYSTLLWSVIRAIGADIDYWKLVVTIGITFLLYLIPWVGFVCGAIWYYSMFYRLSSVNSGFMCWVTTIITNVMALGAWELIERKLTNVAMRIL